MCELGTSGPEVQPAQPVLNGLQPIDLEGWPVDAAEGIDCTVQMVEDMVNEDEELIARVQGVTAGGGDMEMLLLDSGAYTHVCPKAFAPEIPIVAGAPRVGGLTASGQGLTHIGTKEVNVQVWGGGVMRVKFEVMNVTRPLLSVGELQRQGWDVVFSDHSMLRKHDRTIPLVRRGGLSYLPVKLQGHGPGWSPVLEEVYEKAKMALKEITKVDQSEEIWHVVEYCCEGNSLLSEWFLRKGHVATRLGFPEWELRTRAAADAVVPKIHQAVDARQRVLL